MAYLIQWKYRTELPSLNHKMAFQSPQRLFRCYWESKWILLTGMMIHVFQIKGNQSTRDIYPLEWYYGLKAILKIDFAIWFFIAYHLLLILLPNWRLRWKSYDWLTNHGFSTMAFRWIPDTYTLCVYTLKNPMHIGVLYSLILQVIQLNTSDLIQRRLDMHRIVFDNKFGCSC